MKNIEEKIDQQLRSYQVPTGRTREQAWELLSQKLDQAPKQRQRSLTTYWLMGAAAAIVLAFVGLFQSGLFTPVTTTSIAMQQTVWLPDSSMVVLNSRSTLKSNYQIIGGKRQLKLEGEAYFKVKKGKPFIVSFPGGTLKVLGTEFNVIAYSKEDIRIDCTSGKVQVMVNNQPVILVKGQGMHLTGNELKGPYSIDQEEVQGRLNGIYVWHEESLDGIFAYIGNRFGYTISMTPSLEKRNFSGTLTLNNLRQSLEVLSGAMQIKYTIDDSLKHISIEAQ
ncbi:MAG: FecR family protein [Methylococcaceae bacterium]|nr:FecR domain-containing protein [Prolixibacteraceae bacterium]